MTTGVKTGIAIVGVAFLSLLAVAGFAIHLVVSGTEGIRLGREGYSALVLRDYTLARTRFDEALDKRLTAPWRAWTYLNRGAACNDCSQLDEAIHDFTEALLLNPELADAYAGRGWAYQQKGDTKRAVPDLTEAIRRDPNSWAHYTRGLIFYQTKEIDQAIADFDESVRCNPNRADYFVMRGMCYVAKNDLDRALANFDAAIAINPRSAKALTERGYLYDRKGDRPRSEHDFAEARRLSAHWKNPTLADQRHRDTSILEKDAHLDVKKLPSFNIESLSPAGKTAHDLAREASLAYDAGQFDRAIELNNAVLGMNLSSHYACPTLMNRGNAYKAKGDLKKALHYYNEAIVLDPKNAGAYVDRANVLSRNGEPEKAMQDLNKAIQLNPGQWEAYFNRSIEFEEHGQLDAALTDLGKVIELNAGYAEAYVDRAGIYVRKRETDKALADCNTAIEKNPDESAAYISRAKIYLKQRQIDDAERDLEKITQLKSKRADSTLNSLGWLLATCPESKIRNGKRAVEFATQACELTHWKDWTQIDTLAAAYAEAGDFDSAIKYQKQALQSSSSDDDTKKAKERLQLFKEHKPYREKTEL